MRKRRELMTHILMVVAPLLMILALTMAWFINSTTIGVSQMSFASLDTGPGAALYRAAELADWSCDGATVANTVTWGTEEAPEDSAITIQNMVPGQCDYYMLLSNSPFSVKLTSVTLTGADGQEVTSGEALPLAQCLGFYLIPLGAAAPVDNLPLKEKARITCALERDPLLTGQLSAAALRGVPPAEALPTAGADPAARYDAYVLALYLDPVYLQGTQADPFHTDRLGGKLSFSLSFEKED